MSHPRLNRGRLALLHALHLKECFPLHKAATDVGSNHASPHAKHISLDARDSLTLRGLHRALFVPLQLLSQRSILSCLPRTGLHCRGSELRAHFCVLASRLGVLCRQRVEELAAHLHHRRVLGVRCDELCCTPLLLIRILAHEPIVRRGMLVFIVRPRRVRRGAILFECESHFSNLGVQRGRGVREESAAAFTTARRRRRNAAARRQHRVSESHARAIDVAELGAEDRAVLVCERLERGLLLRKRAHQRRVARFQHRDVLLELLVDVLRPASSVRPLHRGRNADRVLSINRRQRKLMPIAHSTDETRDGFVLLLHHAGVVSLEASNLRRRVLGLRLLPRGELSDEVLQRSELRLRDDFAHVQRREAARLARGQVVHLCLQLSRDALAFARCALHCIGRVAHLRCGDLLHGVHLLRRDNHRAHHRFIVLVAERCDDRRHRGVVRL